MLLYYRNTENNVIPVWGFESGQSWFMSRNCLQHQKELVNSAVGSRNSQGGNAEVS